MQAIQIHRLVEPDTESLTLTIDGSADFHSVDPLVVACNAATAGRYKDVTLDLGGLTFICSLAIGAFVSLQKSVRSGGGTMRLINVQPQIYNCLHHARLSEVFTIVAK